MKWPSSRNSLPNDTLSWTSTSWNAERNASSFADDRMKNPQSSVMCSVIAPGARSPSASVLAAVTLAAAMNRLEPRALGLQDRLELAEHPFGLRSVVGRVVADVHVHGDKAGFGPRMHGEMRLRQQDRAGDALRLELEEIVAD